MVGPSEYGHGSSASRMIRATHAHEVCVCVAMLDGLLLARSAFNYNLNHRSVMIFGRAERIESPEIKREKLVRYVNGIVPNQWDRLRPVTDQELKATTVMSMSLAEASAKVRTGQPEDDAADYDFPVWAGIIPVDVRIHSPIPDPKNLPGVEMPEDILRFSIG